MTITRRASGLYHVASLPNKVLFTTLKDAMAAVRYMGGKPVFSI